MAIFSQKNAVELYESLRQYVGQQMVLYGGGGMGQDLVTLQKIAVEPAIYYERDDMPAENPVDTVRSCHLGYADKLVETRQYHPKDDYVVIATVDLVGKPRPLDSMFTEVTRSCYVDKKKKYHPPVCKKAPFEPHLGSWRLAKIVSV